MKCVELPPEKWRAGQCVVTSNWEQERSGTLEEVRFRSQRATVVAFYHIERDIRIIFHRDAFLVEEKPEIWSRWVQFWPRDMR